MSKIVIRKKHLIYLAFSLIITGLIIISYFYFEASSSYKRYSQLGHILNDLKAKNTRLNKTILKTHINILKNYDYLVNDVTKLNAVVNLLKLTLKDIQPDSLFQAKHDLSNLLVYFKKKQEVLEHYKSKKSVQKNSLRFLPSLLKKISKNKKISEIRKKQTLLLHAQVTSFLILSLEKNYKNIKIRSFSKSKHFELNSYYTHLNILLKSKVLVNKLLKKLLDNKNIKLLIQYINYIDQKKTLHQDKKDILQLTLLSLVGLLIIILMFFVIIILRSKQKAIEYAKQISDQQFQVQSSARLASLGEMAGGIAHEINNPLTSIILLIRQITKLNRDGFKNEISINEKLNKIQFTVNRIASIISNLRTFSRDGKEDPFEQSTINEIIRDTTSFCQEKFKHSEIKLTLNLSDVNIVIECRKIQLSQVILNILSNAVDAIMEPVNLEHNKWVTIETISGENDNVQIRITNSGHKISNEIVNNMLNPFFTTKPVGKGTGLGLSISHSIIKNHHGTISINPNHSNTQFIIDIPISHKINK